MNRFFTTVTGSTVSEGGLIEKRGEIYGKSLIRPAEGLEIPRLIFRTVDWSHHFFLYCNKTRALTLGVPITRESVSEVPFAEEPALGFSIADKFIADLAPAFRKPALGTPLL